MKSKKHCRVGMLTAFVACSTIWNAAAFSSNIITEPSVHKDFIPLTDHFFLGYFMIVKGHVKDELGKPIPNVSVRIANTTKVISTDNNGYFSIDVDPDDFLEFSYVGYKRLKIPVKNKSELEIILEPEEGSLQEVAIVAFGKQKKASLVGSQVTVKAEELKLPVRDLTNAIAGRLAGVVAYQRGGAPGNDASDIFIRGISTFSTSPQTPLLVVDGVPDRTINNIDPEDVESFTVLKDASATAVYGTRGANGVILITTKKGKIGKPSVNAEFNQAASTFTELPKFVDAPTFMSLYNEGLVMRGRTPLYTEERIGKHASQVDPDLFPNVNWYDEIFKKYGFNNRATLNVNGGSENSTYYLSAGYFGEQGPFKTDKLQSYNSTLKLDRFNFTSNINLNITKTTKLNFGLNGFITNINQPNYGINEIFELTTNAAPHIIPTVYSNGQWPQLSGSPQGPLQALTQSGIRNTFNNVVRGNIRATQDLSFITSGLAISTLFAYDTNNSTNISRGRFVQTYYATGRNSQGNLITQVTNTGTKDLNFGITRFGDRRLYSESSITYSNKFGNHDIGGLLLFNQSDFSDAQSRVDNIGYKAAIPYRQRNFVGRLTYGYLDKYFLEANSSYSGSDNFVSDKRYGLFPSLGFGWIISNETFFKGLKETISYLKLRYTYGVSGNAAVSDPNLRFLYLTTLGTGGRYSFGEPNALSTIDGYAETRVGGDIQWESSYRQNLGLEVNFFNNDLQLILEVFKERRKNILRANSTIPIASGFLYSNMPYANIGETENKGLDVTLNYTKNFSNNSFFSFRGVFNYNINKNVFDGSPPWRYDYLNRVGRPISQRFGYIAEGLFKSDEEIAASPIQAGNVRPGDIKYSDLNQDGIINADDQTAIGFGSVPRMVFGLNFGGGFAGFDASLFFQGAAQVDFSYSSGFGTTPFSQGPSWGNVYEKILDRWTPENPRADAFYPRLSTNQDQTTNYYSSTWWVKRADYIRLKSAEIGYNINTKSLHKYGINKLRFYANGTNLLTLSKWKFWDPELGDGRGATYPNISTYNLGLRVNFQ